MKSKTVEKQLSNPATGMVQKPNGLSITHLPNYSITNS